MVDLIYRRNDVGRMRNGENVYPGGREFAGTALDSLSTASNEKE
jgi:hypothetical protein